MAQSTNKNAGLSKGLLYRMALAFSLMSVIPLLVLVYVVVNYVFPHLNTPIDISIMVVMAILVASLGFLLSRKIVKPVIEIASEAKEIAGGQYEKQISVAATEEEVTDLKESINSMTLKIRSNLAEIKSYSQKTKQLNLEIHKRMLVLSSLLQVSDIILTSSMDLKDILQLAVSKVSQIDDTGYGILYVSRETPGRHVPIVSCNLEGEDLDKVVIIEGDGLLGRLLFTRSVLVIDPSRKQTKEIADFRESHRVKNLTAFPIHSGKDTLGMLLVGNRIDNFTFPDDELDILKVFTKQIAIAIENNMLMRKAKELELKDDLTGLFNENYILARLEDEIKRAIFYQRPCSFILFDIDDFDVFRKAYGEIPADDVLKRFAEILLGYLGSFGKAGRITGNEFALLLPERNKREALAIAEEIRARVASTIFVAPQKRALTVSVGVSENPIDGSSQKEIWHKAKDALVRAKTEGKNRVAG